MQKKNDSQKSAPSYGVGDSVAYAMGKGMRYGTVAKIIGSGDSAAIEIEFEDGGREVHRSRDRALSLLRRASGASAIEDSRSDRKQLSDPDIGAVRRSDQKRR